MDSITQFNNTKDFYERNKNAIAADPLLYATLIKTLKRIHRGEFPLYNCFNVEHNSGREITVLHAEHICLIFGDYSDSQTLKLLADELELAKFKRFHFTGSKLLLQELMKYENAEYETILSRIVYQCSSTQAEFVYNSGEASMCSTQDLAILKNMGVGFAKAFYGEQKESHEMESVILKGIETNTLYQWTFRGNICSILQVMYDESDDPVIGLFYTNPAFKGQGFGTSLLHRVTHGLLENGFERVMLLADAGNSVSNRVFTKVGFVVKSEYISVYKTK